MKTAWDDNGQNYLISKISLMMFKAVGMAPFNIKKLTTVKNPKLKKDVSTLYEFVISRTGFAYNLCIIIGHWYLGICSILKHQDVKYTGQNELTDKIEICLSGYGNLAITVMWLVHCVKQRQFTTLINRLMYVDANLTRLTDKRMTNLQEKSEVLQLAVMYIMNVCIWIPLLVSEKLLFEAPIVSFFGFMVPAIYCNWFALQYVVAVKLIQIRFKRANDALLDCSTKRLVFPLRYYLAGRIDLDILKVAKIAKIRNACMSLYDIASGIADFYSFPILSVLGYICVHLTYMTYYFVAPFILDDTEKHTNWLIFNSILWLTILTFPFVVLARSVNAIKAEVRLNFLVEFFFNKLSCLCF